MKTTCPYCPKRHEKRSALRPPRRWGRFRRKSDGQWINRFWCSRCAKHFSTATSNPCYRQKKRHKNTLLFKELVGGVSQRECARILGLNRKTVVRKFIFLAARAKERFYEMNFSKPACSDVQFDDLETFEHTKCKPLSVSMMVENKTRRILDFEVSKMPAKGRLSKVALKKYGPRPDERAEARRRLFSRVKRQLCSHLTLRSDSNPHYSLDVKHHFPEGKHITVLGGRGAVTGQGELKKLTFDPLFSLNHTCAMLRANINRLFRRTWCTTKKPERLVMHLFMYALSHNQRLEDATI